MHNPYLPDVERLPDGTVIEDYGRAHARRQADAEQALAELTEPDASIVLWVMHGDRAAAKVYRTRHDGTLRYVVRMAPTRRLDPHLHRLNTDLGRQGPMRIEHAGVAVCDPLDASDDRDLEVSTDSTLVRLDRRKLLERIGIGQAKASLDEVTLT